MSTTQSRREGGSSEASNGAGQPPSESSGTARQPASVALSVAVLGVVYGDIGTSPIYALRECFAGKHPIAITSANVLGILSLMFWTLLLVVSLKYMVFVLQADNRGEGGTFALLALLRPDRERDRDRRRRQALILIGLLGASMLYGGAMITPAISVLSAVEGLQLAAPALHDYVVPITLGILIALFTVQRHGTAAVGAIFGPLTLVWFAALAILGIRGILEAPQVLLALDPRHAVRFFADNGVVGYLVLYAVFLVTTGAEALYADLGHFGRSPIRRVWFVLVLPALLLNYFGQGGILIADASARAHPFFHLAPPWALIPLIVLATAATCIASQAVITGAYSLTRQAMQLGMFPPLTVDQTSADAHGQIYMPAVNWILMAAAIGLVLAFRSSGNLAAAYGVAVNSTMVITTVLAFNVARERGGWSLGSALTFLGAFLFIDLGYLGANLMTIPDGGWLPLVIGSILFTVMVTWRRGTQLVDDQVARHTPSLETLIGRVKGEQIPRVPGTAIFMAGRFDYAPPSLPKLIRHSGVVYERVIVLRVVFEPVPTTMASERIELTEVGEGFYRIVLHYGFMQTPNIPSELHRCAEQGLKLDLDELHYIVSSLDLLAGRRREGMPLWRDKLFAFLARNTQDASAAYHIPADQLMTVGQRVGI